MLHVLCRMPLQTQTIQLPSMLSSVMSVTASTLWFTKQSLDMIASVGSSTDVAETNDPSNPVDTEETSEGVES